MSSGWMTMSHSDLVDQKRWANAAGSPSRCISAAEHCTGCDQVLGQSRGSWREGGIIDTDLGHGGGDEFPHSPTSSAVTFLIIAFPYLIRRLLAS